MCDDVIPVPYPALRGANSLKWTPVIEIIDSMLQIAGTNMCDCKPSSSDERTADVEGSQATPVAQDAAGDCVSSAYTPVSDEHEVVSDDEGMLLRIGPPQPHLLYS